MPVEARQCAEGEGICLRFAATVANIDDAVEALCGFLRARQLGPVLFAVELLAREAFLNAVLHGCGGDPGRLVLAELRVLDDRLTLRVEDDGPGFDWRKALAAAPAMPDTEHGRGLFILKSYADELAFSSLGNALCITKRLAPKETT